MVGNVHTRAGPLGQGQYAANGFDLGHHRAGGQMRQRVDAPGVLHALLATGENGRVFRVHHGTDTQWRQLLEAFEQRAVGGRRQVAEGIADKGLEAGTAGVDQLFQMADGVVPQQAVNTVINVGRLGGFLLHAQGFDGAGRRVGVGHVEHGSDATAGGCGRAGLPGFLMGVARIAEVHMAVDGARQQEQAISLYDFACRRH